MKIVVDMNLSSDWATHLMQAGYDAVHWSAVGPVDARDDAILHWAKANQAVVVTRDLDFGEMLTRESLSEPSVVQLRIDRARAGEHLRLVIDALIQFSEHIDRGALVTIEESRTRLRLLDS